MDVKPGYKQTEVGVIPEEWTVRSVGKSFRLVNGCAFRPDQWKENGTPIIRIQNLNDPSAAFNYSKTPVLERNRVEFGDLLFAWSGTIGTSFGARIWTGPSGVLNQHIFKVHVDKQQVTVPFALLVFARIEEDIAKQAHGFKASFVHVKKSDLVKVNLPLPPLSEQRAIATALSDVDALLGALERLIAKKRDLKQAAMQQLLTGQTRLPGFTGESEVKTLGEICTFENGDRGSNYPSPSSFVHSGIPFVNAGHVEAGKICLDGMDYIDQQSYDRLGGGKLKPGDILFCLRGSLGKFGVVNPNFGAGAIASSLVIIRPKISILCPNFLISYFQSQLCTQMIETWAGGAAQPNLGVKDLARFSVPVPTLAEQTAIATVLSDMDAELSALEQRLAKTRALKQGMMQELLTGRTRLV